MKPQPNAGTADHPPNSHSIRLKFSDSPEDQEFYAALRASSERADRRPVSRHIKHILRVAMGLKEGNTLASYAPSSRPKKLRHLHLISGRADTVKAEDTSEGDESREQSI